MDYVNKERSSDTDNTNGDETTGRENAWSNPLRVVVFSSDDRFNMGLLES